MAIPSTTQPLPSRSVIEFTVGQPNQFPSSTSSRAFGNPSQSYVPSFGTPSNAILGFDQIQVEVAIPSDALGILGYQTVSGVASFPNIQYPFVTGTSESVYCLLSSEFANISTQFLPGSKVTTLSYTIQQAGGTSPSVVVNQQFALTRQVSGSVLGVGEVLPLPTNATITSINLAFTLGFYNQVATPAAGVAYLKFALLLMVNTGFVSLM